MSGLPPKLHIVNNAIPYAADSPVAVPHHWKEEVQKPLDKSVCGNGNPTVSPKRRSN